jgi:hypothetical protein
MHGNVVHALMMQASFSGWFTFGNNLLLVQQQGHPPPLQSSSVHPSAVGSGVVDETKMKGSAT